MGATSSSADGVEFDTRGVYMKWPLTAIKAATARWQALGDSGGPGPMFLTKMQWYELFNDYSVIVDGAFLTVPNEHFAVYDPSGSGSACAYQVFAVLGLFGDCYLPDKLEYLFNLFDFDGSGGINQAEMLVLLSSIIGALHRLGVIPTLPTPERLDSMTSTCFTAADVDEDLRISVEEFKKWAADTIEAQSMLKRLQGATSKRKAEGRTKGRGGRRGSAYNRKADKPAEGAESGGAMAGAGGDAKSLARAASRQNIIARKDSRRTRNVLGVAESDEVVDMSSVRARQRVAMERKHKLIANGKVMHELVAGTKFELSELKHMAKQFVAESDVLGNLERDRFEAVIASRMPHTKGNADLMDRLYATADLNNDGRVDFREFTIALSTLAHGNVDAKMDLIFQLHDRDGDGTIAISELAELVRNGNDQLKASLATLGEVVDAFDEDHDGGISKEEFINVLHRDAMLLSTFTTVASVTPERRRVLHSLRDGVSSFTNSRLVRAMDSYCDDPSKRKLIPQPISSADFSAFMSEYFLCGGAPAEAAIVRDLYATYDVHKDEGASLRDLLNGFIQTLASSQTEAAEMLFDLYDADNGGSVDRDEIMAMLLHKEERMDGDAAVVLTVLADLDKDGNERVSKAEFSELGRKNAAVMDTFDWLFGGAPRKPVAGARRRRRGRGRARAAK